MAKLVSQTYGDALMQLAVESNRMEEFLPQAVELVEVLTTNQELVTLLEQPKIVKAEKVKIIEDIFEGKVAKEIIGLMIMLIEKAHYADMADVFTYFVSAVKEAKRIGVATVTTALEISDAQKSAVEKKLLETTSYETFEMHYVVDASLIGGMTVRIGDKIVDNSVKTKLYQLSKELKAIQVGV